MAPITRGDSSASVAFTLGANNGAAVTNIEYSVNNGLTWTARTPAATGSPLSLTSLTNGTPYQVKVRSINAMGTGTESNAVSVTPARAPDAPTVTTATGENGRAVITFAPNGDGGTPITNYSYSIDNGVTWTTLSPATTIGPIIVTGLTNGTSYPVRLKAINGIGESTQSAAVTALPSGPPLAPTITTVTGSNGTLSIAFTEGFNGGAPITGYQVSTDGGDTWSSASGTSSPLSVSGLINGVTYSVAIRAVNSRGPGTVSSVEEGVPATVPDAPQITEVISASGAVDVAFAFGGNGGSTITNIAYSIDGGDTWVTRTPASRAGPLRLTGLTNGTTYPVRIRAINNLGHGAESEVMNALAATTPDAPTLTSVTSGNGDLMVSFTAPAYNGGAPILNYQYSLDGGDNWVDSGANSSPIEINSVSVGTQYDVAIRAVNLRGPGTASNATSKRATAPPAPPTITSVQEGNGEITIRYVPPSDTGGDTLQDFYYSLDGGTTWDSTANAQVVSTRNGGIYSSGEYASVAAVEPRVEPTVGIASASTTRSLIISNLVNGSSYDVALRASNVDALGVPSGMVQAIPSTVPSVPRNLSVVPSDATMSISWDEPSSDGGLAITRYEYTIDGGTSWNDVVENPMVLRGLRNGVDYDVQVRAFNNNGASAATVSATARPTRAPRAPSTPTATAGVRSVMLTWSAPEDDGGTEITDYVIELSDDAGNTWQTVADGVSTATSVQVSNLTVGRKYLFRVTPVNAVGTGEASIASNTVEPQAPVIPPAPVVAPEPIAAPSPVAPEPVATPIAMPIAKPVSAPKKQEQREPVQALPDVSAPRSNDNISVVRDNASAVYGMPESGWVKTKVSADGYKVRTSEGLAVTIKVKSAATTVNSRSMPIIKNNDSFVVAASGLRANSETSAWIFSTPTLLGRQTTDARGALNMTFPIPASVAPGIHTVQLNALTPEGEVRSIEVKIEVFRPAAATPETVAPTATDNGVMLPTGLILMASLVGLILAIGLALGVQRRRMRPH